SSRRRHTRSKRDWSSDVCSSDLYAKRTSTQPEKCNKEGMPSLFLGNPPPSKRIPWEATPEAKEKTCATVPAVREIVSWELAQKQIGRASCRERVERERWCGAVKK